MYLKVNRSIILFFQQNANLFFNVLYETNKNFITHIKQSVYDQTQPKSSPTII